MMDFGLSEEQQMLKQAARDFWEKECPKAMAREMAQDEKGLVEDTIMPLRRAKAAEVTFGDADVHREIIARELLDKKYMKEDT